VKNFLSQRLGRDFRDSLTLALGTVGTTVLALSFNIYCGKRLGPAEYSVFVAVLALVTLGTIPAGPINATLARFAAQLEAEGRRGALRTLLLRMVRTTAGRGALALVLLLPALPLFQHLLRLDTAVPLGFGYGLVYLTVLVSLPRGVLRGLQRFSAFNAQTLTESGLRLLVGLALVTLWPTATLGLVSMAIALLLAMGLAIFQLRPIFHGVESAPVDLGAARRFFGPALLFTALFASFQHLDILLIKGLFPPHPAGEYGAAATLARGVGILVTPLHILLLPRLVSQGSRGQGVTGLLLRVLGIFGLISALVLASFLFAGDSLIQALFGADFAGAAPLLAPLALSQILVNLAGLLAQPFLAEGRFSFLALYGPLLLLEAVTVYAFHPSLLQVAWVLVAYGAVSCAALVLWLLVGASRRATRQ